MLVVPPHFVTASRSATSTCAAAWLSKCCDTVVQVTGNLTRRRLLGNDPSGAHGYRIIINLFGTRLGGLFRRFLRYRFSASAALCSVSTGYSSSSTPVEFECQILPYPFGVGFVNCNHRNQYTDPDLDHAAIRCLPSPRPVPRLPIEGVRPYDPPSPSIGRGEGGEGHSTEDDRG